MPVTRIEKKAARFYFNGFSRKTVSDLQRMSCSAITIESGGRTMKKSQNDSPKTWANDPSLAARYAPIHGMVTELLAKTDPGGYAEMLAALRDEWRPVGAEVRIVELMAEAACRLRGCAYLEAQILNQGMEACAAPNETPGMALGRAYIRDFEGPDLIDKLSRYRSRLSTGFTRCSRILRLAAKSRRFAEARIAATLAKCKPCTSVIQ
jgi:hypothetical protein